MPGCLLLSSKVIGMSKHCASLGFPGRAQLAKRVEGILAATCSHVYYLGSTKGGRHRCTMYSGGMHKVEGIIMRRANGGRHHCSHLLLQGK